MRALSPGHHRLLSLGHHRPLRPGHHHLPATHTAAASSFCQMFKARDDRFKKSMELEYAAHVAPGSYGQEHHSVAARQRKVRGKASPAFASTSLRGDLFMGGP